MRVKLSTADTRFVYEDGRWTLTQGRNTLTKKSSESGTVIPGTRMEIVPIGKAFLVGLQISIAASGDMVAIIPVSRGDQLSAMQVAADWNMRAGS